MRKSTFFFIIVLGLAIDQLSKEFFVQEYFPMHTGYTPIFWDFLWLRLSYNTGVAFSLPISWLLLQVITLLIILGIGYYFFTSEYPKKSRLLDTGYALVLAGAISHAYERITSEQVIDFISVKYFAILNFADILISIWALLIIVFYVRNPTKK